MSKVPSQGAEASQKPGRKIKKPFCWQNKFALRRVQNGFQNTHQITSAVAAYVALTQIASDQQSDVFEISQIAIANLAGISSRTLRAILPRLSELGVLKIDSPDPYGIDRYELLDPPETNSAGQETISGGIGNGRVQANFPTLEESSEESFEESSEESVIEIYGAYPKKVAKPEALKAIRKALKKIDAKTLLEKVKAFARATAGSDPQFIPHPATWFNGERFSDDPSTWTNGKQANKPVVINSETKF